MTDASWLEYERLVDSGEILGLGYVSNLKNIFPTLRLGPTADLNHFWFYSLCAAIISKVGAIIGINYSIHDSFLLLHCILLASMFIIAWRCYKWKGLAAAIILTFISPIIWYFDKVHTEFFTYCLTTSAVILIFNQRYFPSALFLALAATQNISFTAISIFLLCCGLINQRKEKYSFKDIIFIVLTICIFTLQPVYYYSRFGVFTPQMIAGGVDIGGNLKYAYIWLFDPDVGLFPNWPVGIVLLALSIFALRGGKLTRSRIYFSVTFLICYICVSLLAQSSTTNLNSGATPGLARYSLWYLALFFPIIFLLLDKINFSKWTSIFYIGLMTAGIILNFHLYYPNKDELGYIYPSSISKFVQTYLPNIYNPHPEIFAERYGGIGENASIWSSIAVFGPDCKKFLFINPVIPDSNQLILGGKGCNFDYDKLKGILEQKDHLIQINKPIYEKLSDIELRQSQFTPHLGKWYSAALGEKVTSMMNKGWSNPESWGTWTDGKKASLIIPCPSIDGHTEGTLSVDLELQPFTSISHPYVDVIINIRNIQVWYGKLEKDTIIQIGLPKDTCVSDNKLSINLLINNPISPASLGLSTDRRELGVGLLKIRFSIINP